MKKLVIVVFMVASAWTHALAQTNIDAMEYFFDSDPGLGNGIAIPVSPGPSQNKNIIINTSGMTSGFHAFWTRAKHQSGNWGVPEVRIVYVASEQVGSDGIITDMEYYFDSDPGQGNGTQITITGSPTSLDFSPLIAFSSLTSGFHALHTRARDNNGNWGIPDIRAFYVVAGGTTSQANITQLEYFFDTEPGYGAGIPLTVTAGSQINIQSLISSSSLSNGFHLIGIRARDDDGQWGIAETKVFYVDQFSQISAVEYFLDTDPGKGAATSVSITPGGAVDQTFTVPTASLPTGSHTFGVRAARTDGSWGNTSTTTFTIKEGQTITFAALASKTVGDAPFTLAGTTSSGLTISYTSSNPLVATISGNTVTIVGAGTTVITASQVGDTNYAAAPDVQQTLTVLAAPMNNTPAISSSSSSVFYVNSPVAVNNLITVTDADGSLASATVSITSGFQASEDQLLFTSQNGISGTYNSATGVLALSGTTTAANYQASLRSIQYNNTATSPGTGDRTISFQVNDGVTNSSTITTIITINKPPLVEAPAKDTQAGGNIAFVVTDVFSDPDDNLDFTTLTVTSSQGALVTISNGIITVNYNSLPDFEGTDQLTFTICDAGGQCQTELVAVEVGADVEVFNGISSNIDGMNDFMKIKFLPAESKVVIFNRWGEVVFETEEYDNNDSSKRFEGNNTNGTALNAGTYFYKIVLPDKTERSGYVHLKR